MTYSGKLYKCIVAVTSPEAFNINKWDDVTTSEVYARVSKRVASHTVLSGETYKDVLDSLGSQFAISDSKEYLLVINATVGNLNIETTFHARVDYRDTSIVFTDINASSSKIDVDNYTVSNVNESEYTKSRVDTNGFAYSDNSNNAALIDQVFTILELPTI